MKARACDACWKRKIHCDGAAPRCDWCLHHDQACTFNRPVSTRRRGKGKKNKTSQDNSTHPSEPATVPQRPLPPVVATGLDGILPSPLSSSTASLSNRGSPGSFARLAKNSPSASDLAPSWSPRSPDVNPASSFGQLHFAGCHIGDISSFDGIPFFSAEGQQWIRSRTGESAAVATLGASGPPWQMRHRVPPSMLSPLPPHPDLLSELPDRSVAQACVGVFRRSPFRLVFPVIDTVLFEETLSMAYDARLGPPSIESLSSRACVFAFLAFVSLHHPCRESVPLVYSEGENCAVRAQYLIPQILYETSLTGLQTTYMLGQYHLLMGQLQMAAMFHSVACRTLTLLGAHTAVVPALTPEQAAAGPDHRWRVKNQLRNIFWLCYWYDKEISLRIRQPPVINDDDCDLTLPPGFLERKYGSGSPRPPPQDDAMSPFFPGDPRLHMLTSKTYRLLYSAKALRKSDAELIRDIRQLDDELEAWRSSFPPYFRPTLSFAGQSPVTTEENFCGHGVMEKFMLHLSYLYLVSAIHQAAGRCGFQVSGPSRELEGVSSSLVLAVEASRSTLRHLRVVAHVLMAEAFWMVLFYPISAIVTVFCSILYCPLNSEAEADLELLRSAPNLIKEMRLRRAYPHEVVQMKAVDDMVAELARLAHCAIVKARQEAGIAGVSGGP